MQAYGNKDYVQHAAGTLPFRNDQVSSTGRSMKLEPNEGYWQGRPKLDKLVLLPPMPEPSARLAGLPAPAISIGPRSPPP